jgi:hypothetical protein
MKRLTPLALAALALAIAPVALGGGGGAPPATGQATTAQTQQGGSPNQRFQILRLQLRLAGLRLTVRCGSSANGAPPRCLDFAQKVEQRLQKLDANVQARIAKIQQTCGASGSTSSSGSSGSSPTTPPAKDPCANADTRIARLQKIDARVQAFLQKVQAWLGGSSGSSSTSGSNSSDSSLDQAAAGLGQLTQQVGGNG